jgi:2-phosphoglycerate kinase
MATIVDGKKRIPFMRGMLVHYLIQRGFAQEEARQIANAVRDSLGKQKDVSRKDMVRLVEKLVAKEHGERLVGDLVFWERLPTTITVERKKGSRPFSKELLSHSIQATGLAPDQAYKVAQTIESHLIDQRRQRVSHAELEELTAELLAKYHDDSYAERYHLWRAWGDLDRPLIILIGGASGVGKTTLAIALANLLDIPRVVATDDIRQVMRLTLSAELMPALHCSSYTAWKEIPEANISSSEDPVIVGYREQTRVVSVGVRAILSRCIEENASVIIDGVHLIPDFLELEAFAKAAFLIPFCLELSERQAYEERFAKRASESPARAMHKYLSHLDNILKIQAHIVESCAARGIPAIDSSVENLPGAAVMVIGEYLQEHEEMKKVLANGQKKKKG